MSEEKKQRLKKYQKKFTRQKSVNIIINKIVLFNWHLIMFVIYVLLAVHY